MVTIGHRRRRNPHLPIATRVCNTGAMLSIAKTGTSAVAACVLAALGTTARADSSEELAAVMSQIQALKAQQRELESRQQQLSSALNALEARLGTRATASDSTATAPVSGGAAAGPANVARSRVAVTGDFRLRDQMDSSDRDGRDRNSSQIRGRVGATIAVNDRVTLGARLVTGDADDPNSTDVQLANFDDDLQVSLDLAYVQVSFGDLQLYGGKVPQPFTRTDLVWDGDVNPQGVSGVYKHALTHGGTLRANALVFPIDEQAAGPESTMFGGQIGYDSPTLGKWKLDVSAAYYDYTLGSTAGGDSGDFRSNLLNADGSYQSDFDLGDLIVGATWSGLGERWPVRMTGDYVRNFGAATAADTGYGIDLSLGRTSRPGEWRVTYGHAVAQTDAVFAAFSHDNTSIATNYELHALAFDYVPLPKTTLSAIWYHYKPDRALDAGSNDPKDWLERLRLYFLVSF